MGSTKYAPQRSQFEPILGQPGAARWLRRSVKAWSLPCNKISSSRLYAAFQLHLVQATRMVARGSSRSRPVDLHSAAALATARSSCARVGEHVGPPFLAAMF
jgi:hypothetical protein